MVYYVGDNRERRDTIPEDIYRSPGRLASGSQGERLEHGGYAQPRIRGEAGEEMSFFRGLFEKKNSQPAPDTWYERDTPNRIARISRLRENEIGWMFNPYFSPSSYGLQFTPELEEILKERSWQTCGDCGAAPIVVVINSYGVKVGVCPQCGLELPVEMWERGSGRSDTPWRCRNDPAG